MKARVTGDRVTRPMAKLWIHKDELRHVPLSMALAMLSRGEVHKIGPNEFKNVKKY